MFTAKSRSPSEEPSTTRSGRAISTTPQQERRSSRRSSVQPPESRQPRQQLQSAAQSWSQTPAKLVSRSQTATPTQRSSSYIESGAQMISNVIKTRLIGRISPIPEETDEPASQRADDSIKYQLMAQAPFDDFTQSQTQSLPVIAVTVLYDLATSLYSGLTISGRLGASGTQWVHPCLLSPNRTADGKYTDSAFALCICLKTASLDTLQFVRFP